MPVRFHSTALFVKDIEISKRFYTEQLGQSIELDFGKNVILKNGITLWEIQSHHIIPQIIGNHAVSHPESNRFELYFETEELEATYERLTQAGVSFLHPIHEEPWGQRTFRLFDPDSHLIEIGEPLNVFVRRLHGEGMAADQISRKTGVPMDMVQAIISK